MKNIHLHSVTVNLNTLDILSADTDFYGFIGRDRLYNTFEKFIHPDCRDRFFNIVGNRDTAPFVIDIAATDNTPIPTYMIITYDEDRMDITLEPVTDLVEGQEFFGNYLNMAQDLLGLHNDLVFTYDAETNLIRFFTPDSRRCTSTYTLEECVTMVKERVKKSEYDLLEQLLISIKSGSGSFAYTFTGNIIAQSEDCKSSIVKGIATKNIESISTVGYIHRGSNKAAASHVIERDALTGVYSKAEIAGIARKAIEIDHQENICICIMDIDYFKMVNDNFGHMAGDVILKEVADIISKEVGSMGVVGRFGGDEFYVMFYDVEDMELCREKLRSIKNIVNTKYPKTEDNSKISITLSIGCANYPKDADNYDDLFTLADFCLYRAKDKGRNRYIIYNQEKHGTLEEIKNYFNNNRRIDSRKDMAMGDVICMISDKHFNDSTYTPDMLIDDLVENLPFERIVCLGGKPLTFRYMSGINLASSDVIKEYSNVFDANQYNSTFDNDLIIVNDTEILKNKNIDVYNAYKAMGVKSFILVKFYDKVGKTCFLSLEMTTTTVAWNLNQTYNYRTIARLFSRYEI